MRVIVQGRLKQRSYETKEGEKRTVYEVEVDEVGPSLKSATAKVVKTQRGAGAAASAAAQRPTTTPGPRPRRPRRRPATPAGAVAAGTPPAPPTSRPSDPPAAAARPEQHDPDRLTIPATAPGIQ
jgi:single-strand DNA-binding protein